MASLRDTVKDYQDELRDGIAWVAFWKQGRSWNAEYFHTVGTSEAGRVGSPRPRVYLHPWILSLAPPLGAP